MTIAALVAGKPLTMGVSGGAVRQIQLALKAAGYPLTGTGYFGQATDTAIEEVQRKAGLPITGVIDVTTANVLDGLAPKSVTSAAPLWLTVALNQIGLKEAPGSKDNPELVAEIQTVAHDYQHDSTPWCAGFVSLCLLKAGEKPSSAPLWALSYSDTKREPVVKLAGPAVGAIAVKTRNGGGHVTFVAGRTRGGTLACCGGNQNDEVNVSPYREDAFVGFYWPKAALLPAVTGFNHLPIVTNTGKPVSSEA